MQDFLRMLASWLGLDIDPTAELQVEFSSFPTGGMGLLVLVGAALALLFVVAVYKRDARTLRPFQRAVLAFLRIVAVGATILLLLEPNLVAVRRETRPGHTILLLDQSQSMTHRDAWRRDGVQGIAQAWKDLGVTDLPSATRMDLAKSLLQAGDGQLARVLGSANQLQAYGFAGSLDMLPTVAATTPAGADPAQPQQPGLPPRIDLARLDAAGRATNLGAAVRSALDRSRSAEVAALVLLSDGRRTAGPQAAEVARLLNQGKVPHTFVLGIGDPSETQSVSVSRLEAPEKVFQKDPFELKAFVSSQGYEPMSVAVRLVRTDEKGATSVVRTTQAQLGGTSGEVPVEFSNVTSDEVGRFAYRVEIEPPSGEPASAERHHKSALVEVLGERTRVLLVAGGSSHEYQILRNLLMRDQTIDVSCWLQSADENFPQDGDPDVQVKELPADRKALDVYDVVVLVDPDSSKLQKSFCENVAKHVVEGGCGLWWVAGEKFTLEALRPGAATEPLANLLPVQGDISRAERQVVGFGYAFPRPWPWTLTTEGEDGIGAKVTRIADSREEAKLLWGRLPGFHFAFPVSRAKPAATVLVEHGNPELKREGRGMVLMAMQPVGAGRVIWQGTDESYRWRSLFEAAYNRYWVKGVRWLFEGRLNAGNSRMRILLGDEKIELGEAMRIAVEAKNETFQPLVQEFVELTLEREGQPAEALRLEPVAELPGTYETTWRPAATGFHRVKSILRQGREVEASFQVVPAQFEKEGPMDRAELAAIAAATGGELFDTPAQLLDAVGRIGSRSTTDTFRTPHALWDGWPTLALVLAALTLEWLLRKRFNLL